jgi:hypothetical protein
MWELVVYILSLVNPLAEPPGDYIGPVAAEAAYAAAQTSVTPAKPKVPTSECTNCNGTGRVRTGDGQGWTKCPDCDADLDLSTTELLVTPGAK